MYSNIKKVYVKHIILQIIATAMSMQSAGEIHAVAESFFATLKKQAIYGERFLMREAARQHIFEYIECYYNRVRRHSTNGWISPVEAMYYKRIEGVNV